jgi:RNA polymerase sigma-70 factor (ECF subfamily)
VRPLLDTAGVTDEALMLRVQREDLAAFAELYGRHSEHALRVAATICRDWGRAEDAAQDGFLSIWRSRADYRPQSGSFEVWSMGIIRNRAIDSFRVAGSRPPLQGPDPDRGDEEVDPAVSPLDRVIADAEHARLFASLRRLPDPQAEAIVLSFYGGLSHTEIAVRLGLPTGTVKGRIRNGLQKLRFDWPAGASDDSRK